MQGWGRPRSTETSPDRRALAAELLGEHVQRLALLAAECAGDPDAFFVLLRCLVESVVDVYALGELAREDASEGSQFQRDRECVAELMKLPLADAKAAGPCGGTRPSKTSSWYWLWPEALWPGQTALRRAPRPPAASSPWRSKGWSHQPRDTECPAPPLDRLVLRVSVVGRGEDSPTVAAQSSWRISPRNWWATEMAARRAWNTNGAPTKSGFASMWLTNETRPPSAANPPWRRRSLTALTAWATSLAGDPGAISPSSTVIRSPDSASRGSRWAG